MKHVGIIIGIALMLMSTGAVSAACFFACNEEDDPYHVPEGRYLTIDSYGNVMLAFYPQDALAPFGRFADGTPIPDGYLNPATPMVHKTPAEQREAFNQMPKRPHTGGGMNRGPVR